MDESDEIADVVYCGQENIERGDYPSYTQWRSKFGYHCGGYIGMTGTHSPLGLRCLHWSGATDVSVDESRQFAATIIAICDAMEQEERERNGHTP